MGLVLVLGDAADWLVRRRRVEMSSVSVREIGGILGRQLLIVAQAGPGVRLMGIGCVSGLFEPPADDLPAGIYLGRVTRIISGIASDDGDNVFANALGGGALPRFVEVSDRLIVEALAESGLPWDSALASLGAADGFFEGQQRFQETASDPTAPAESVEARVLAAYGHTCQITGIRATYGPGDQSDAVATPIVPVERMSESQRLAPRMWLSLSRTWSHLYAIGQAAISADYEIWVDDQQVPEQYLLQLPRRNRIGLPLDEAYRPDLDALAEHWHRHAQPESWG